MHAACPACCLEQCGCFYDTIAGFRCCKISRIGVSRPWRVYIQAVTLSEGPDALETYLWEDGRIIYVGKPGVVLLGGLGLWPQQPLPVYSKPIRHVTDNLYVLAANPLPLGLARSKQGPIKLWLGAQFL